MRSTTLLLAIVTSLAAADLALDIPPVRANLPVENQTVAVVVSGRVAMQSDGADKLLSIALRADLADLQAKILAILQAELNQDKKCGDRLSVTGAALVPDAPASVLTADFHYEKFACAKALGKEIVKRLVAGNGTMRVRLTPEVDSADAVRLRAEVLSLDADGQLGEMLRSGEFGDALREKIRRSVTADLEKSADFSDVLPPAVRGAAAIQSAQFDKNPDGRLLLTVAGELRVSGEQAAALAELLKKN